MQVFAARFCGRCRFLSAFVDLCLLLSLFVDVCRIVSICECLKPGATEIEFWSPFLSICVGFCRLVSAFVELCRSVIAFHTKRIWRGCRERRKKLRRARFALAAVWHAVCVSTQHCRRPFDRALDRVLCARQGVDNHLEDVVLHHPCRDAVERRYRRVHVAFIFEHGYD